MEVDEQQPTTKGKGKDNSKARFEVKKVMTSAFFPLDREDWAETEHKIYSYTVECSGLVGLG